MSHEKIRVLIANSTRVLRDVLYETIREEPDIEVVGDVGEDRAILLATERTNPDCLIVPLEAPGSSAALCNEILAARPHVKIVAIGDGSDVIAIYWRSDTGDVRCTYTTASREAILRALHFTA